MQHDVRIMKNITVAVMAGALFAGLTSMSMNGAEANGKGGARGGRLLEKTEPAAEFLIEKDRTVSIKFYDASGKTVNPAEQSVTVVAEPKGGKQTIEFEKKGDGLVSKTPLPEGDGYNLVVQFRQMPEAKPQNFRFKMNLSTCGECKRAEYACICEH